MKIRTYDLFADVLGDLIENGYISKTFAQFWYKIYVRFINSYEFKTNVKTVNIMYEICQKVHELLKMFNNATNPCYNLLVAEIYYIFINYFDSSMLFTQDDEILNIWSITFIES